MEKLLAIVGPTAVGKTNLSIKIAKRFNGEVISGDSMQVYRHLDVGTAKVSEPEQEGIPHHLINIIDVNEQYSVADFTEAAQKLITEIISRGHLPIIVGGTGFYVSSLLNGLSLGSKKDPDIRTRLNDELKVSGPKKMWEALNQIDPVSAAKIPVENTRRIIRALEVYESTGKPISHQVNSGKQYDDLVIGLNTDRKVLYQRINDRVDLMMQNGLIEENEWLFKSGGRKIPASKGIGYREFVPYFDGREDLDQVRSEIKKDSRHYAKRQLTWFRNKMSVSWYDLVQHPDEIQQIERQIKEWRK